MHMGTTVEVVRLNHMLVLMQQEPDKACLQLEQA